jgi:hypothetical protein
VNKSAAKKVIEENLNLFQKSTHSMQPTDYFLDKLCNQKNKEYTGLHSDILLGIPLGFGRNNSVAFANRSSIQKLTFLCLSG